jgi:L-fuconolactonase
MVVVDTHCHASPYWFEPVETLLDEMTRNSVDKATLVQFFGVYDNSYLIECMRRFPGRFSVVALVDVQRPDAPEQLAQLKEQGVEGIRFNTGMRSPGRDPLAVWRKAAELGMVASVMGTVEGYAAPEFESLVKELPDLKIVIEHLGGVGAYFGPGRADKTVPYETYQTVLELAKYPNTSMKMPGLGEFCARPMPFRQPFPFGEVPPLIEMAIDAFSPQRLMWGSDFPPVAAREGYRNALQFPVERLQSRSEEDDRELIFGKTAATLWRLGE